VTSSTNLSPVGRFEKVLLATDGSDFCVGAERVAIALCQQQGAHLDVVSAIIRNAVTGWMGPQADGEVEQATNENLARVKALAEEAGLSCATHLVEGDDPYEVIVECSRSTQADVIVMGRRGRRGLARLMLGDATAKVIGYAPCAVLVVPEESDMWHSILLATDGSRFSDAAAVTAAELAKPGGLPLCVLSVKVPFHTERRQAEARSIVDRILDYMKDHDVPAVGLVEEGAADETILAVAEERDADLIVLGSFGRTGMGRVLFGTKAERVINYTKGPVLVVRGG
jgi:nucleotide-binding universal stress UspA family protein